MSRRSKHSRPAGYTKARAEYWRVSVRVAQQWIAKGVPVDDDAKMADWFAGLPAAKQARLTPQFRQRIAELQTEHDAGARRLAEAELAEFNSTYKPGDVQEKSALADLKRQFAFFLFKQQKCAERGDKAGTAEAMTQVAQLSGVIHDMELRAQKLGKDLGDLVPRKTLEAPARHLGYHLLRCADAVCAEIVGALTRRDPSGPPLVAEEIRAAVEPILLNAYILQPLVRASHGDNPAAPPPWLVAAMRAGAAEVLESAALDAMPTPAVPV